MMNPNKEQFHQSLRALKETRLSSVRKELLKERIYEQVRTMPPMVSKSEVSPLTLFFRFGMVSTSLVFVLLAGIGGISYGSLPGSSFYRVKTDTVEPFLAHFEDDTTAYAYKLADRRLAELEEVLKKGTVTETDIRMHYALLESHLADAEVNVPTEKMDAPEATMMMTEVADMAALQEDGDSAMFGVRAVGEETAPVSPYEESYKALLESSEKYSSLASELFGEER